MAITYGFFDSAAGDRLYSAADLTDYFLRLIPDGVAGGLEVTKISGLVAQISAGWAFIRARWCCNSDDFLISFAASAEQQRIDRVCLRLNLASNARSIAVRIREGTAEAPPIPVRTGDIYEISLAQVVVGAEGIISINDERSNAVVCGIVQGFGAFGGMSFRRLTRAQYDALTTRPTSTQYIVTETDGINVYIGDYQIGGGTSSVAAGAMALATRGMAGTAGIATSGEV